MKNLLLLFWTLLSSIGLYAQENIFDLPLEIEQPEWYQKTDWNNPNIYQIEELINIEPIKYKQDQAKLNREEEEDFKEDPYLNAYRRWKEQLSYGIQEDGSIIVDQEKANQVYLEAFNKAQKTKSKKNNLSVRSASWKALGPMETFSSGSSSNEQVNCYVIAIAPSNPNTLYLNTETGVTFKSKDKGLNWFSISDHLPQESGTAIAVDPLNEDIVYMALNSSKNFLLKTTDGGANWSLLSGFPNVNGIYCISLSPATGRILVGAANGGVYFSDNGGINWIQSTGISANFAPIYDVSFNPGNSNIVYAVKHDGTTNKIIKLYYSLDEGATFQLASTPEGLTNAGAKFATSANNPNIVYCIALGQGVPPSLAKSIDAGKSYIVSAAFTGTGIGGTDTNNGMSNGQGFYDLAMMANPLNANEVIVGTTSSFRSTDGGLNFTAIGGYFGDFNLHPDMQSMAAHNAESYIVSDGGVTYSTDFFNNVANAYVRIKGINGSDYWGFGQGWVEDVIVGGRYHNGNAALYSGYPTGQSLQLGGAESPTGHVIGAPGKHRDVGFDDIGTKSLPKDIDGIVIHSPFRNTLWPNVSGYGEFSSKLMIHPNYSDVIFVGNDEYLWKSENRGTSYKALHKFNSRVYRYDISRTNPNVIYLCTFEGINKTTDGGQTWSTLNLPANVIFKYYNPTNENVVWFSQAQGDKGEKIFKSIDGGSTWINYGDTLVEDIYAAFIVPQGGTDGGVYLVHAKSPSKIYYRDNTLPGWVDFSDGLPTNTSAKRGAIIYYGSNKLRIAGNRGIWETPLYQNSAPQAMPMTTSPKSFCSRDTVLFTDYSILNYEGAKFKWSFPGASFVSDVNALEPKVIYSTTGTFPVSLTVTDAENHSSTTTINDMITVESKYCDPDTVIENCLKVDGNNTFQQTNIGTVPINSNTFSISCWIKPKGKQRSFSQIIAHPSCPGSLKGLGLGFAFLNYTPNLYLCYTDQMVGYSNNSGLVADTNKWNHVVLAYSPTGVKLYLNGVGVVVNNNMMPKLDLSQSAFIINLDLHGQAGDYKGEIDEVKIYNYTLSETEIREKMHLIYQNPFEENGLVSYVQFNKVDTTAANIYELIKPTKIGLPGGPNNIIPSSAPVATGTVERQTIVEPKTYKFDKTGLELSWNPNEITPNGELTTFRLRSKPDQLPHGDSVMPAKEYYIINNFGMNKDFDVLSKLKFNNLAINSPFYDASNFSIYKRESNDYGDTWGNALDLASMFEFGPNQTSTLEFNEPGISNFGQIIFSNDSVFVSKNKPRSSTDFVSVYPVPAKNKLHIKFGEPDPYTIPYLLMNTEGRILLTGEIPANQNFFSIDFDQINDGVYFLRLIPKNKPATMHQVIIVK